MRNRKPSRRRQRQRSKETDATSDEEGYLDIGGIRIRVDRQGNVGSTSNIRRGRQPPQRDAEHANFSEEQYPIDREDLLDYLQNVEATSDTEEAESQSEDGNANKRAVELSRHFEMLARFSNADISNEGAVEDLYIPGEVLDDADGEDSSIDVSGGSESSFSSSEDTALGVQEDAETPSEDIEDMVLSAEELATLDVAQRYPVQVRTGPPSYLRSSEQGGHKQKGRGRHRPAVKGAKNGLLAPGEKKRLRRERIEMKRAQRAVGRGFDVAWINKQLSDFVQSETDVHVFPPMPKHECRQVQRLATLYGCKSGAQGSGKKRSVVVTITARTALPDGNALLEVGRILACQSVNVSGSNVLTNVHGGRWSALVPPSRVKKEKAKGKGTASRSEPASKMLLSKRKSMQPVAFVSRGVINPDAPLNSAHTIKEDGARTAGQIDSISEGEGSETNAASLLEVYEDRGTISANNNRSPRSSYQREGWHLERSLSRGAAAADGISNPGRLLGLGMALGVGSEIFGAPGRALEANADLSPLQPALSKATRRKLARASLRRSTGGMGSAALPVNQEPVPPPGGSSMDGDYADFERHTKGIGSRLLAKWGFAGQGAGLGREGSGIAEPIQASRRAKGLGLGA